MAVRFGSRVKKDEEVHSRSRYLPKPVCQVTCQRESLLPDTSFADAQRLPLKLQGRPKSDAHSLARHNAGPQAASAEKIRLESWQIRGERRKSAASGPDAATFALKRGAPHFFGTARHKNVRRPCIRAALVTYLKSTALS